jgi:LPS-assembly lipoprotein
MTGFQAPDAPADCGAPQRRSGPASAGRRRFFGLLALPLALSGCGFEPLYARRDGQQLPAFRIDPISNRSGQILRNYLIDRLAPTGQRTGGYSISIQLYEPNQVLALRRDDVISRLGYSATAAFQVRGPDGKSLMAGSSSFATDYEVTNSEFATLAAERNARERVLELISDDIRQQIFVELEARR